MMMSQASQRFFMLLLAMMMPVATIYGQGPSGGRGGPQGGLPAGGRGGVGFGAPSAQTPPKPLFANAKPVPSCKLTAATAAAVAACDPIDGVTDGVIEDPQRCTYDPKALLGTSPEGCAAFTQTDVDIIRKLWQGPTHEDGSFLWYGQPRGADLTALSVSRGTPLKPQAFAFSVDWLKYFITQNPQFDWNTITAAAYQRYWDQSVEEYGAVIGTDNPDLTDFRNRGGKAIVWHGWADQLISADGTIDYYRRVQQQMGGSKKTSQSLRLFLAPGVAHCAGGTGPAPSSQMEAILAWVEEGRAPDTLSAARREPSGGTRSRPLCAYPLVAKYKGTGSTDDAANFVCSKGL
jgi:hypothetical protein